MKHLMILADGMSDHPVASLGGKTPLEFAATPTFDRLAKEGRCGMLDTIPEGFSPGSEVAINAILGYDPNKIHEGRGPLEAAGMGYEMQPYDMAMRCNIISLADGRILNHHGGHPTSEEGKVLIEYLDEKLGSNRVKFIPGMQYRHLLAIKGGSKHIVCAPPHDYLSEEWRPLLVQPEENAPGEPGRMTALETADLINDLIIKSQELLAAHPSNKGRRVPANSIWPWSPGYRPAMLTLQEMYPAIRRGSVITAVDLVRGIGKCAGLRPIDVEGATGLADTNYEGKARAALRALKEGDDFVFLHVEATDEAGHDGDVDLKVKTIEYLDQRLAAPIMEEISKWDEPVAVAILPDHATPVELRVHRGEPVPFVIWYPGIRPDSLEVYSEMSCRSGSYGLLRHSEFMKEFMKLKR